MKELQLNEIEQVNGGGAVAVGVVIVVVLVVALGVGVYLGYQHAKDAAEKK